MAIKLSPSVNSLLYSVKNSPDNLRKNISGGKSIALGGERKITETVR